MGITRSGDCAIRREKTMFCVWLLAQEAQPFSMQTHQVRNPVVSLPLLLPTCSWLLLPPSAFALDVDDGGVGIDFRHGFPGQGSQVFQWSDDPTRPTGTNPKNVERMTTHAHELALTVVFQSDFQHTIGSSKGLRAQPGFVRGFLHSMPASWDETRVLSGEPGKLAIIARRHDATWYVGGINGTDQALTETLDLGFLGNGKHRISLIADTDRPSESTHSEFESTPTATIPLRLSARGGFAAKISPQ